MAQVCEQFSDQKVLKMLNKLGYDDRLYSTKSRVFVVTFHATEDIRVRIADAVKTDLNEKAANLMMDNYLKNYGAEKAREDNNIVIFRKYHDSAYASSYAAVNKTNHDVEVNLDMTSSTSCVYTPTSGKTTEVIPANSLRYLGA